MVEERIKNTPRALERICLSILSTACKNMVVNKKENTNMPIIEDKKGRISEETSPTIMKSNNR